MTEPQISNRQAVKIKQADYIELHRMVSNLTPKEVWRQLSAGTYSRYVKELPDELQELAEGWAENLRDQFIEMHEYAEVCKFGMGFQFPTEPPTRKEQALYIQSRVEPQFRGLVFSLLDGRDIAPAIWKMLEPDGRLRTL